MFILIFMHWILQNVYFGFVFVFVFVFVGFCFLFFVLDICTQLCYNEGTCTSQNTCICRSGYTGSTCETSKCSCSILDLQIFAMFSISK